MSTPGGVGGASRLPPAIVPRDVVALEWFGRHRAVVLDLDDGPPVEVRIIIMTSKVPNEPDPFFVDPSSRAGKSLRLKARTYFLKRKVRFVYPSTLSLEGIKCPPDLYLTLLEIAD